ncbi:MAG: FAD-dependent oxidoreductase [Candidatus Doudnabacteria bacterium]|nr:FAD-dependent oxidoreductase [Candidatus Doudnabacteria bacterium]
MTSTTLLGSEEVAAGTRAFHFAKPDGFTYEAGQSIDLFLVDPPETDAEGNKRAYSLSSSPEETQLTVTTRMRDTAFKRVLASLPTGSALQLDGPFGSMTLHQNTAKPAVFLAGGIGITPFYSMIKDTVHRKLPHNLTLLYSNRTLQDAAYHQEIQEFTHEHSELTYIPTMTDAAQSGAWNGETGYISGDMIKRYVPNPGSAIFYMAGPLAFVTAMKGAIADAGGDPDNIRFEEFSGY